MNELHMFGAVPVDLFIGTPIRVLASGQSRPILFRLETASGEAADWVVKPPVGRHRQPGQLLREYVGSELAAWAGVLTPAIGLLRFPSTPLASDDTDLGREVADVYQKNAGQLAFCSRFLEAAVDVKGWELDDLRGVKAPTIEDALRVFALDVFMRHHDRKRRNPNLLARAERLIAVDHGLALAELGRIDTTGLSVVSDIETIARDFAGHACAKVVGKKADSEVLAETESRVLELDDAVATALASRIPVDFDRSTTGAPAGLRDELVSFLRAQRERLPATLRRSREAL